MESPFRGIIAWGCKRKVRNERRATPVLRRGKPKEKKQGFESFALKPLFFFILKVLNLVRIQPKYLALSQYY
jgi:hypothetical protein